MLPLVARTEDPPASRFNSRQPLDRSCPRGAANYLATATWGAGEGKRIESWRAVGPAPGWRGEEIHWLSETGHYWGSDQAPHEHTDVIAGRPALHLLCLAVKETVTSISGMISRMLTCKVLLHLKTTASIFCLFSLDGNLM